MPGSRTAAHPAGGVYAVVMGAVPRVHVAGAGPAGAAAAIAAAISGAPVVVSERSRMPRHKVCGEFLSPEILAALEALGVRSRVEAAAARITRLRLRFPKHEKTARLPDAALGLSRLAFDQMLIDRAVECGAAVLGQPANPADRPLVLATGRQPGTARRGSRMFGFKAHFDGPASDAIELFFFGEAYVGVNAVEGGRTNVCGLAPEAVLAGLGFDYDSLVAGFAPLRERLVPLGRGMDWLSTGPLIFGNRFGEPPEAGVYPAGDALSFVDPFTGTGLAAALITGRMAGECAATGIDVGEYVRRCRRSLGSPYAAASLFRAALRCGLGGTAAWLLPAEWLVRLSRPRLPRAG